VERPLILCLGPVSIRSLSSRQFRGPAQQFADSIRLMSALSHCNHGRFSWRNRELSESVRTGRNRELSENVRISRIRAIDSVKRENEEERRI
jgi:hypothetical protein